MPLKCFHNCCNKIPIFNILSEKKDIYCIEHKKENIINIKDKKCIYENCNKIPNFNLPSELKGIYCAEHKTENMINVISKKCIYNGCNKQPTFNLSSEKKANMELSFMFRHSSLLSSMS